MVIAGALNSVDLVVDQEYGVAASSNAGDEPIHHLLGVSNQGGFRYLGQSTALRLLVLFSSFKDADWPDFLDPSTGVLTYFGDNKKPGRELHDTPRRGNRILRDIFAHIHNMPPRRDCIPPIFVFAPGVRGRSVIFKGLAVPGASGIPHTQDLIALWKVYKTGRYQNYRATLTILDSPVIPRAWISDVARGQPITDRAPGPWRSWQATGVIRALRAEPARTFRTRPEQVPSSPNDVKLLNSIFRRFSDKPHDFEICAGELTRLHLGHVVAMTFTPPSRDGGRDVIGKYLIGSDNSRVSVEFAVEAKCYTLSNSVGVREVSRLISRLRHRQFGVLVTTSYLHQQAYQEIIEDGHPILVISAVDILRILRAHGFGTIESIQGWLDTLPFDSERRIGAT